MNEAKLTIDYAANTVPGRHRKPWQRRLSKLTVMAICSVLLVPGIASAKKPVASDAGCVIFPLTDIYTNNPFKVKIVRDPSYTGVWSQPIVEADAVFTKTDGGNAVSTSTETTSRYGVTYDTVNLMAPSCKGTPCEIDTTKKVVITAVIKEPINKGKRFRETICTPVEAIVYEAD